MLSNWWLNIIVNDEQMIIHRDYSANDAHERRPERAGEKNGCCSIGFCCARSFWRVMRGVRQHNMEVVDFSKIAWPAQWTPIYDEYRALEFGRSMNSEVAGTIVGELQREMCQEHPLYGVACQPIAYDARIKKDFLFQTEQQEARFVLVHFTWQKEPRPNWPIIIPFQSIQEFLQYERKYQHETWLSRIFKRISSWASRRSHKAL